MEEVWKDVIDYEGLYQVSNLGHVRSLDHYVAHSYGGVALHRGRLKKVSFDGNYLNVTLSKDGKTRTFRVHRLVAAAFIPNPDACKCVNHIDGNKRNNVVSNLEWCTHRQNTQHAINHGLITFENTGFTSWPKESREHYSKIRKKAIVRSDGKQYKCTADAAADLGVTYSAVSHVLRGLEETCRGYSFSYA